MNVPKLIQSQSKLLFKRKKYFGLSHKRNVKSLLLINSKRSYCRHTSSTLPAYYNTLNWTEDELKVLGTYQGVYFINIPFFLNVLLNICK